MSKQLYVNLGFNVDTGAAEANLQKLKTSLSEISRMPFQTGTTISSGLKQAATSAQELQRHLAAAMNTKTGNLDLSKFQASLTASNQSLSTLSGSLLKAGTTGEQAFLSLSSAIGQSNVQLTTSTTMLSRFATTLKNTLRWQLSASLIQGVITGLSSAINYAQDLDESLNNIRIVTQKSTDEMAKFADRANAAAKALRTSTTEYTNAALIYYQQGLDGKAVEERANTTVKLANVTGKSAQEVSQWMTAIWNNFDDGTKSLEYYADAITALGAATASSSDEIATGLEKFAAVAETVGLSYEYATAALATVTAQTRQSADVVGTAFKTLFARMQDLKLGETLDDGTTLGQYSQAMAAVGVNIKDASGELKEMDTILDELGAKWEKLDKDQQVALAKSVAGLRQYNQFIALMDNYDFMKTNIATAAASEGTLQNQADVYAESWEGASARVKASLEGLYGELVPTDDIIKATNGLADMLDGLTDVVEAFGGLKTIMLLIATTVMSKFQANMAGAIDSGLNKMGMFIKNINIFNGSLKNTIANSKSFQQVQVDLASIRSTAGMHSDKETKAVARNEGADANLAAKQAAFDQNHGEKRSAMAQQYKEMLNAGLAAEKTSASFQATVSAQAKAEEYTARINAMQGQITSAQKEQLTLQLQSLEAAGKKLGEEEEIAAQLELQRDRIEEALRARAREKGEFARTTGTANVEDSQAFKDAAQAVKVSSVFEENGKQVMGSTSPYAADPSAQEGVGTLNFTPGTDIVAVQEAASEKLREAVVLQEKLNNLIAQQEAGYTGVDDQIEAVIADAEKHGKISSQTAQTLRNANKVTGGLATATKKIVPAAEAVAEATGVDKDIRDKVKDLGYEQYQNEQHIKQAKAEQNQIDQQLKKNMSDIVAASKGIGNGLMNGLKGASQLLMGLNMVTSAFKQIKEEGMSLSNVSSLFMGFTMFLPSLVNMLNMVATGYSTIKGAIVACNTAKTVANALNATENASAVKNIATKYLEAAATQKLTDEEKEAMLTSAAESLADAAGIPVDTARLLLQKAETKAKETDTAVTEGQTAATWAQTIAEYASIPPILIAMAAILLLVIAIAALVAIINAFTEQSPEEKLAAAKEEAKASAEAFKEAKEAAEGLRESLNKYNEAVKTLQECRKGTEEWTQALKEVNNQALELLGTYPELAKYAERGLHGEIVISEEGQKAVQAKADQRATVAQAASVAANQQVRTAQIEVDKSNLADQLDISGWFSGSVEEAIQNNLGELSGMTPEERSDWAKELAKEYYDVGSDEYNQAVAEWSSAIHSISPGMDDLRNSIDANTEAIKLENEMIASNYLSNDEYIANSEVGQDVMQMSGDVYEQYKEDALKALDDKGWGTEGIAQINGANDEAKKIWGEYLAAAGLDPSKNTLTDTTGNDKNRTFVYLDENDEEKEISLERMKQIKASADALEKLGASARQVTDKLMALESSSNAADKALASMVSNKNFDEATESEVNAIKQAIGDPTDNADIEAYLDKQFGDGQDGQISDDTAKQYGYESADAMIKAYKQELKNFDLNLDAITKDLSPKLKEAFNNLDVSNVTITGQKALTDALSDVMLHAGDEGVATFTNIYNQLDSDELDTFAQALDNIDWQTTDVTTLQQTLKDLGIETKISRDDLEDFIDTMSDPRIPASVETLQEQFDALYKIQQNVLDSGSIDLDAYTSLSDTLQEYFVVLADGTAQFVGNILDFQNAITGEQIKTFTNDLDKLFKRRDQAAGVTKTATITADASNLLSQGLGRTIFEDNGNVPLKSGTIRNLTEFDQAQSRLKKYQETMPEYYDWLVEKNPDLLGPNARSNFENKLTNYQEKNGNLTPSYQNNLSNQIQGTTVPTISTTEAANLSWNTHTSNYWEYSFDKNKVDGMTNFLDAVSENGYMTEEEKKKYADAKKIINSQTLEGEYRYRDSGEVNTYADNTFNRIENPDGTVTYRGSMDKDNVGYMAETPGNDHTGVNLQPLEDAIKLVEDYNNKFNDKVTEDSKLQDSILEKQQALVQNVEDIDTLQSLMAEGYITAEAYNDRIMELEATIDMEGIDLTLLEEYAKGLQKAAKDSDDLADSVADDNAAAQSMAKTILRLDKGIEELANNFENWEDIIKNSTETSQEYISTVNSMRSAASKLLDVNGRFISDEFLTSAENLELFSKAAEGNAEAIETLRSKLAESIMLDIQADLSAEQVAGVQSKVDALKTMLETNAPILEVGASIKEEDQAALIQSFQDVVDAAGMTVDQANAYFDAMGYEVEYEEKTIDKPLTVPQYRTTETINESTDEKDVKTRVTTSYTEQLEDKVLEGTQTVSAMGVASKGNTVKVPDIKVVRKKAPATMGNYSKKNSGGGKPGGSSSGGGSKSKKDTKKLDDELERYHEINEVLNDIANALDEVSALKDRAYGKHRIALLADELSLLDEQIRAQDELIQQNKTMLDADKDKLKQYGAKFDDKGRITNYDEMYNTQVSNYNKGVSNYNSNQDEDAFDKVNDAYENFKNDISQYEESLNAYEENQRIQRENFLKQFDLVMEGIEYSVEVQIEVRDDELRYLERVLRGLDDDLYDSAERVKYLSTEIVANFAKIDSYADGIRKTLETVEGITQADIDAFIAGDGSALDNYELNDAQMSAISEFVDGITEATEAIEDLRETIENQIMDTFDAWIEKFEDLGGQFKSVTSIIENYQNIIDTVGKSRLDIDDAILADLEAQSVAAANGRLANAKAQLEFTEESLQKARDAYDEAVARGDEASMEHWGEVVEKINAQLMEDQENFTSSWAEALQTAAEVFEAQMSRAFDKLDKKLAGTFGTLEKLAESYEQQQTVADRYLDHGEKLYELSKLNRKIQKDIDISSNVRGQRELAELQAMINAYHQDDVEMSQADLEALQKRYDLKLAEIALEEAQNAKSQVRLTRNSEGGMSYVYTANETNTETAAQNYEDKLEENRKLAEDQSKELTSQIIANRQAMVDALRDLRREDYDSTEDYLAALEETTKFYTDQEAYLVDEKNKVIARSQITYADDYLQYNDWSGKTLDTASLLEATLADNYNGMGQNSLGWVTTFGEHTAAMIGDYEAVADSAAELLQLLGGVDGGVYGEMYLRAGAWVTAYGEALSSAKAEFPIITATADQTNTDLMGPYHALIANAATWSDEYRTIIGNGGGRYLDVYNAMNELDGLLGLGTISSAGGYGVLLANAQDYEGSMGDILRGVASKFNLVISDTENPDSGANYLKNTLGSFDTPGTIFGDISIAAKNWEGNLKKLMNTAGVTVAKYGTSTGDAMSTAEKNYKTFSVFLTSEVTTIDGQITSLINQTSSYSSAANQAFTSVTNAVTSWQKIYSAKVTSATKDTNALTSAIAQVKAVQVGVKASVDGTTDVSKLNQEIQKLVSSKIVTIYLEYKENYEKEGITSRAGTASTTAKTTTKTTTKKPTTTTKSASTVASEFAKEAEKLVKAVHNGTVKNDGSGWKSNARAAGYSETAITLALKAFNDSKAGSGYDYYYDKALELVKGYDTGGYTGEWGPDGRWALLHQKEIVLNAADTKNILQVVDIVRELVNQIDFNSMGMFANLTHSLGQQLTHADFGNTLDQNVTITAEFPNATNREEISAAFGDLVNLAAQYAGRK